MEQNNVCKNCRNLKSGDIVRVTKDSHCVDCGREVGGSFSQEQPKECGHGGGEFCSKCCIGAEFSPSQPNEQWSERFDNDFHKVWYPTHQPFDCWEAFDGLRVDIKQFIESVVASARSQERTKFKEMLVSEIGALSMGITKDKSTEEILKDLLDYLNTEQ